MICYGYQRTLAMSLGTAQAAPHRLQWSPHTMRDVQHEKLFQTRNALRSRNLLTSGCIQVDAKAILGASQDEATRRMTVDGQPLIGARVGKSAVSARLSQRLFVPRLRPCGADACCVASAALRGRKGRCGALLRDATHVGASGG